MTNALRCGILLAAMAAGAQVPRFDELARNYPNGSDERIKRLIGGRVDAAWVDHTCAVRLSRALNYSGLPVPRDFSGMKTIAGGDGKNYAFQVRGMRPWLEAVLGPPRLCVKRPGSRRPFLGKRGVIAFVIPFSDASGHVDLWDGATYTYEQGGQRDPRDYFAMATEVVLWETR